MKGKKKAGTIVLSVVLIGIAMIYVIPFLMMVLGSFKIQAEAAMFDLALPTTWEFSNYTHVMETGKIVKGCEKIESNVL